MWFATGGCPDLKERWRLETPGWAGSQGRGPERRSSPDRGLQKSAWAHLIHEVSEENDLKLEKKICSESTEGLVFGVHTS
jgi:hypothetical protein